MKYKQQDGCSKESIPGLWVAGPIWHTNNNSITTLHHSRVHDNYNTLRQSTTLFYERHKALISKGNNKARKTGWDQPGYENRPIDFQTSKLY